MLPEKAVLGSSPILFSIMATDLHQPASASPAHLYSLRVSLEKTALHFRLRVGTACSSGPPPPLQCDFKPQLPLQSPCRIQGGLQVWTSGSDTVTTQPLLPPVGLITHTDVGLRQPHHSLYWASTPPSSGGRTGARMSEWGPSGLLRVTYGAAGRGPELYESLVRPGWRGMS